MNVATKPLLLQAFDGTNTRVPVWFMRQAGRYLPEYQAIRKKYPLEEMFTTPELAAEISCQPVGRLGVDAAILFADILTMPARMGFDITFHNNRGPVIANVITSAQDIGRIHDFEDLDHIVHTVRSVKERLPDDIALIGFAGGPFTVLSYLIEGGSSTGFRKLLKFILHQEQAYHRLMAVLTANTIRYLNLQRDAGADVYQLFDSWAGTLRAADYARLVLPYVQRIFEAVDLPSIYFVRNTNHLLPLMDRTKAQFLSVDHTVVLGHHTTVGHTKKGIQGNLFNGLLYAGRPALKREVNDVLVGGNRHGRYIFNLSHGVFPDVSPDTLKSIVDQVHDFERTQ